MVGGKGPNRSITPSYLHQVRHKDTNAWFVSLLPQRTVEKESGPHGRFETFRENGTFGNGRKEPTYKCGPDIYKNMYSIWVWILRNQKMEERLLR